ncbi:MAG: NAD(+)/NADH kinase [Acidimicrobiia bacterium]|nr:NAD(+)/NADH kinase [Acidimicrobiia bacterium]
MTHVRVIVNCGAGSVDDDATREQCDEISKAFDATGASCDIEFVQGDDLEDAIGKAADEQPDVVVVAGGDGSLGTAAAVLAERDTPLGVLALGTFNHFAKDLGIPLDVEEAAAAIVDGTTTHVDVVEVNGRCFVNNSSLGVYPEMVAVRDRIRDQRGWGKVRAVPVAAWRVLRRFPMRRLHIRADGYDAALRSPFVFIGNGRYEVGPGGVGDRSDLDGGELCLYVARAATRRKLLLVGAKAILRGATDVPELEEHCASELTIDAHGHRVTVALDGEVASLRSPLHYRCRKGALGVRVSRPA